VREGDSPPPLLTGLNFLGLSLSLRHALRTLSLSSTTRTLRCRTSQRLQRSRPPLRQPSETGTPPPPPPPPGTINSTSTTTTTVRARERKGRIVPYLIYLIDPSVSHRIEPHRVPVSLAFAHFQEPTHPTFTAAINRYTSLHSSESLDTRPPSRSSRPFTKDSPFPHWA
jgi:hypothetical protein